MDADMDVSVGVGDDGDALVGTHRDGARRPRDESRDLSEAADGDGGDGAGGAVPAPERRRERRRNRPRPAFL